MTFAQYIARAAAVVLIGVLRVLWAVSLALAWAWGLFVALPVGRRR